MTSYAASLRRRPSPAPLRGHASDLLTILNPDTHYTIFDCITNLLDIKDILRLERTCSTVNWFLKKLKDTKWNIDQQLIRFFDNPSEFRSLQAKCDFLLSGRFVAGFFDRDVEMGTDLDVFISQESLDQLVKYLITKEGFKGGGQNQPEFSPKLRNLEVAYNSRIRKITDMDSSASISCVRQISSLKQRGSRSESSSANGLRLGPCSTHTDILRS